jgi:hypothetical protein
MFPHKGTVQVSFKFRHVSRKYESCKSELTAIIIRLAETCSWHFIEIHMYAAG